MAKISANLFRRLTLGMGLVSSMMLAYEDGKLSKDEIVLLLNQLFQGLGMEVDFAGLSVLPAPDGGLDIHLPPELLEKIS